MATIHVRIVSGVSDQLVGTSRPLEIRLEFPGPVTVREVLGRLADRYGDSYRKLVFDPETEYLNPRLVYIVDNIADREAALDIVVHDGSKVLIAPVYEGG